MIAQAQNTPLARVRVLQRSLYRAAKANPTRKFGVLYDKLCRADVLQMAYARVSANHGAAGIDQQTFEVIEKEIGTDTFLRSIQEQLSRRRYKPLPVRRVYIPKADGSERPLGIPVIIDRVVQAAVKIVIEPLFEADFKDFSYGFRPRKSAHQAPREVYERLKSLPSGSRCGYQVVLRPDTACPFAAVAAVQGHRPISGETDSDVA